MSLNVAVWSVLLLALISANLPFVNQRLFAVIALKSAKKSFWLRLIELAVGYLLVGAIGFFLEAQIGTIFAQGWQFYAITVCLFIVGAFPGFVFQYLRRA